MMTRTAWMLLMVTCMYSARAADPAGVNRYTGRQERSGIFEFTSMPRVEKTEQNFIVKFTSKAACDATVAIVDGKGKIVRHLASGLLGENAPWPFKQDSLSQAIEWDGKDDTGKPAPAGCKVRVGLGLTTSLDRFLGWTPGTLQRTAGIAIGRRGDVFVLTSAVEGTGLQSICPNVVVFNQEGQYLRRILPQAASVPPEKATIMDWSKTTWGADVPGRHFSYIVNSLTRVPSWANTPVQTPVVTADGKFVFMTGTWRTPRHMIMVDVRDGATPPGSIVAVGNAEILGEGDVHLALSPDGKWIYGGVGAQHDPKKAKHAVVRVSMETDQASIFAGDPEKLGADNLHFNLPRGVACDKAGNVYVADNGNNRIQVFKSDGGFLKSISLQGPDQVAVNPNSNEIYATQAAGGGRTRRLVKLGGVNDPTIKAFSADFSVGHDTPVIGVDTDKTPTVVWLRTYDGVSRYEEKGDKLDKTLGLLNQEAGWEGWSPWTPSPYVTADPYREELYLRDAGMCGPNRVFRVDARTGKVIEKFDFPFEMACVGPDRMVYMRITMNGRWIVRYDPDKRRFDSFPDAKPVVNASPDGKTMLEAITHKGQPLTGFHVPADGTAWNFEDVFGIAPNGDFYIPAEMPTSTVSAEVEELKKAGYPTTGYCKVLRVYSKDGKLKCVQALPGLGFSNGVRIGRTGAVYIALMCKPIGQAIPDGLATGMAWDPNIWGTLAKFNGTFDKYPVGRITLGSGKATHDMGGWVNESKGPANLDGLLWSYGGMSPLPFIHCHCWKSTFDLDLFERSFVPAAQTCTVNVLDANGNVIVRIGGYGNADSRGADSPVLDSKTGEYRPRRADDPRDLKSPLEIPEIAFAEPAFAAVTDEALYVLDRGNQRIVRAVLKYRVEETVPIP